MVVKKHYTLPRKGPNAEVELEQLYRRRNLLENLIRTLEDYTRESTEPPETRSKVA